MASIGKGDPKAHLRPTTDRTRETLFSILQGGRFDDPISGARVLDLFAGTGALAFEALSRGASFATLVDSGRVAAGIIERNIKTLDLRQNTKLLRVDATKLGPNQSNPATLVFVDPPYGKDLGPAALDHAAMNSWIAPSALIVVEDNSRMAATDGFEALEDRRMGDTHITFLRAKS